jgi:hypothetical protein
VDGFRHEYNSDRPHQSLDMAFPADRFIPAPAEVVRVKLPPSLGPDTQPVPPSGNLQAAGKQFWLGPARSGVTVTFWADTDVIHLLAAGTRIKSVRSHLSTADLAVLLRSGGRPAADPPLPPASVSEAVEVDRTVNRFGSVSLVSTQSWLRRSSAGVGSAFASRRVRRVSSTSTPGSCCGPARTH